MIRKHFLLRPPFATGLRRRWKRSADLFAVVFYLLVCLLLVARLSNTETMKAQKIRNLNILGVK